MNEDYLDLRKVLHVLKSNQVQATFYNNFILEWILETKRVLLIMGHDYLSLFFVSHTGFTLYWTKWVLHISTLHDHVLACRLCLLAELRGPKQHQLLISALHSPGFNKQAGFG